MTDGSYVSLVENDGFADCRDDGGDTVGGGAFGCDDGICFGFRRVCDRREGGRRREEEGLNGTTSDCRC